MKNTTSLLTILMVALAGAACSSGASNKQPSGSGGTTAAGGSSGRLSAGGAPASGGVSASAGSTAAPRSGGSSSATSTNVSGGTPAAGNTGATGGTSAVAGASGITSSTGMTGGTGTPTATSGGVGGRSGGGQTASSTGGDSGGQTSLPRDAGPLGGSPPDASVVAADGGGLSPGCGKTLTRPSASAQQTISVAGTSRSYLIDIPSSATNQTPLMLIFALHGYGMTNSSVVGSYNFTSRSNGQAITVYPQGIDNAWANSDTDYNFMQALITDLEARYCIDPARVFLTGFSNGAVFANEVACQRAALFRAYAPVEGAGPGGLDAKNNPVCAKADAQPAIMVIVGDSDTTATPEQARATRDFWVKRNGCSATASASYTGCETYSGCAQGKPVVYCHGNWNHTISATATANIWAFFKEQ